MMGIIAAVLLIALIIATVVALCFWLSLMTLSYYVAERYRMPTDEELAACRRKVIEGYLGR